MLSEEQVQKKASTVIKDNPFQKIYQLAHQLSLLISEDSESVGNMDVNIKNIANEIQCLAENNVDALIGAVHLCFSYRYSIIHSIHTAILCEIVGKRVEIDPHRRIAIMAAALTSNISMLKLQDDLQIQRDALTAQQRDLVHQHPKQSVDLLKKAGVKDIVWLSTVIQHHERLDGSGYPKGLKANKIAQGPRLIAVADRYTAMVADRAYRVGMHAKDVLKAFFMDRGLEFDENLSLALIKELGIFPPGIFVRLKNKEIGVVIKRNEVIQPTVSCILNSKHGMYPEPVIRNCSANQTYNVEDTVNVGKEFIKKLNLAALWGF